MPGFESKVDNVLDLAKDEKLKVQLEIRKLASDLKKEVTNSSDKKKEAISQMDSNFDYLLHQGKVEVNKLKEIKDQTLDSYAKATISTIKEPTGIEKTTAPIVDQTIDDVNNLKIKGTIQNTTGALESTQDTQEGVAKKLEALKIKQTDIEEDIKKSLTTIDQLAEAKYDVWKPREQMTKPQQDIAFTNFAHDVADEVNVQLLTVEERTRMGYRFELLNLKDAVLNATQNNATNPLDIKTNT